MNCSYDICKFQKLPEVSMSHNSLSKILKAVTVITALIGLAVCFVVIPFAGKFGYFVDETGRNIFLPWAVFLWIAAVPCFLALILCWKICSEISRDNSFSDGNAVRLKYIAILALADSIYVFIGNLVLLFLHMNYLAEAVLLLVVVFVGIAISLIALTLSRLVSKAADMKKENELTI